MTGYKLYNTINILFISYILSTIETIINSFE